MVRTVGEHVSAYTVLPDEMTLADLAGDIDLSMFAIEVQWAGGGDGWAIRRGGVRCLSRSGEWAFESIPSGREDDWLAEHRWPLDEALEAAKAALPSIRVNGWTWAGLQAHRKDSDHA